MSAPGSSNPDRTEILLITTLAIGLGLSAYLVHRQSVELRRALIALDGITTRSLDVGQILYRVADEQTAPPEAPAASVNGHGAKGDPRRDTSAADAPAES